MQPQEWLQGTKKLAGSTAVFPRDLGVGVIVETIDIPRDDAKDLLRRPNRHLPKAKLKTIRDWGIIHPKVMKKLPESKTNRKLNARQRKFRDNI